VALAVVARTIVVQCAPLCDVAIGGAVPEDRGRAAAGRRGRDVLAIAAPSAREVRVGTAGASGAIRNLRLDTRADLVEARRLYERIGYREIDRFNGSRYAGRSFAKRLS
jgi:hypothetical protein